MTNEREQAEIMLKLKYGTIKEAWSHFVNPNREELCFSPEEVRLLNDYDQEQFIKTIKSYTPK